MAGDLKTPGSEGDETLSAIGGIEPVDAEDAAGGQGLSRAPARAREMLTMFSQFRPLPSPLTECAFILSLVHMLLAAGNDQLTEKILISLVTLVAGVAGGYGVGRSRCG